MKTCCKCKEPRLLTEFCNNKSRKDGKNPQCKPCDKLYRTKNRPKLSAKKKQYHLDNKELINKKQREYYHSNKDLINSQNTRYLNNPKSWAKRMLNKSKERALESGVEHSISLEDIDIPKLCPYLGVELTFLIGSGQLPTDASIDRIDSSKGYVKDNIQIISRLSNTMKSNATRSQLIIFAKNVIELYS